jgi:hypothetical protein
VLLYRHQLSPYAGFDVQDRADRTAPVYVAHLAEGDCPSVRRPGECEDLFRSVCALYEPANLE